MPERPPATAESYSSFCLICCQCRLSLCSTLLISTLLPPPAPPLHLAIVSPILLPQCYTFGNTNILTHDFPAAIEKLSFISALRKKINSRKSMRVYLTSKPIVEQKNSHSTFMMCFKMIPLFFFLSLSFLGNFKFHNSYWEPSESVYLQSNVLY